MLAVKILGQALKERPPHSWRQLTGITSFLDDPAYKDRNKTCFQIIALSLACVLDQADDPSQEEDVRQRMQALEGLALFQSSISIPSGVLWLAFRLMNKDSEQQLPEYEAILRRLEKSNLLVVSSNWPHQD